MPLVPLILRSAWPTPMLRPASVAGTGAAILAGPRIARSLAAVLAVARPVLARGPMMPPAMTRRLVPSWLPCLGGRGRRKRLAWRTPRGNPRFRHRTGAVGSRTTAPAATLARFVLG